MSDEELDRAPTEPWRWPRYSLRSVLLLVAGYAGLVFLMKQAYEDEDILVPALWGGLVLIWSLFCWRFVRLNRDNFTLGKIWRNRKR